jgi:hypothetical protein
VIANGPSLGKLEMFRLRGEITIAMNRAYLLFDSWGFLPSYYACINELVLEQFSEDIRQLAMPKFLNWNRRRLFLPVEDQTHFLRFGMVMRDRFARNLIGTLTTGGTVTFACLQVAYHLGCRDVVVVGLDHRFAEQGTPNKTEIRQSKVDASHCHPDYFPKGTKWQLPDLRRSEQAYKLARAAFEGDGRQIRDATVGGHCDVFEKVDFESLF